MLYKNVEAPGRNGGERGGVRGAVGAQHNGGFNLETLETFEDPNESTCSDDVHEVQRRNLCIHLFKFFSRLNR